MAAANPIEHDNPECASLVVSGLPRRESSEISRPARNSRSPFLDVLGRKRLSHTIRFAWGRYHVTDAEGRPIGAFATLTRADHEGRLATAEDHAIDRDPVR